MQNLKSYEEYSPETISREQLDTALAGLSLLSRDIIRDELIRAHQETTMEYHRNADRSIQEGLYKEIECLNFVIASCIRASNEFREILHGNSSLKNGESNKTL